MNGLRGVKQFFSVEVESKMLQLNYFYAVLFFCLFFQFHYVFGLGSLKQ